MTEPRGAKARVQGDDRNQNRAMIPWEHNLFLLALHIFTTLEWKDISKALYVEFDLAATGATWTVTRNNCSIIFWLIKKGRKGPRLLHVHDTLARGGSLSHGEDEMIRGFLARHGQDHMRPIGEAYMRLPRPLDANQANTSQSNQPGSYPTLTSTPFQQAPAQQPRQSAFRVSQHQSAFQP